jgi:hypothetical protein
METRVHGRDRCSIAGIGNNYSGFRTLRSILCRLVNRSAVTIGAIQRPFYDVHLSLPAISNISEGITDLTISENRFSVRFAYRRGTGDNAFVDALVNIWREYEQPFFCFYVSEVAEDLYADFLKNKSIGWGRVTDKLFNLSPCYAVFKSVEEDVIWIDKAAELSFDDLFTNFAE